MIRRSILVFLASLLSLNILFWIAPEVSASGRSNGVSYFLNQGVDASTHKNVLQSGLVGITTKQGFVNRIKSLYSSTTQYGNCAVSTSPSCDFAGARYIIQTMRGKVNAGNWDYGFPDAGDVADWEARVMSPNIGMRLGYEGSWAEGTTTARYRFGSGATRQYDIATKTQSVGGRTVTFYNVNNPSQIYYMLEVICANPVGKEYGLPSPSNFTLTPTISVNPTSAEGGGGTMTATSTVNNGGSTPSTAAQWKVTTFTVAPGAALPAGGLDNSLPTAHYGNGATVAAESTQVFARGNNALSGASRAIPDAPVGTRVCYALSVQPYSHADARWNHSTPACTTILKKPRVQVLNSDLMVGRGSVSNPAKTSNIITSQSTKSGLTYGSWAEYAIVPSGTVTGMASGSAYVGGASTNQLCRLSVLTFSIASPGSANCGAIGNYTKATIAPNVSARFPINVAAANVRPGFVADPAIMPTATLAVPNASVNLIANNLSGQYQVPAGVTNLTITGGASIPKGRWIVINAPETTVTITGNITYTGDSMTSLAEVPQVVLIAKNIIIADSVSQIDSWLITTGSGVDGRINTCGAGGVSEISALVYTQCNTKLTVNGPVIANHLIMRRTYGAGTGAASGEPAEVFNLRADAYIWATNYNLHGGRIPTVATKELPPRF